MTPNDLTTQGWQRLDSAHHMAPFTDYGEQRVVGARIITHAEGHYIFDSDGTRILDGMAGLWCVNVGYGRKSLVDAAAAQMTTLPYYNNFFKTSNKPVVALSKRLADITPDGLNNVFYANSGSEANDTIIRMVRHFWALEGRPEKRVIIGREYGYHGSTIMSASMGGMSGMHQQAANEADFVHIRPPYGFLHQGNQDEAGFAANAASWLEDKIVEIGADKVAAFVAEPVQGAGGVIVPPAGYFDHIQAICKRHDILFIVDEVITGFGRSGEWFASSRMNLSPDMMTMAKGLTSGYIPMSGVMVGDRVANRFVSDGGEFYHGFTYSGHPVAAAVALANLDIIEGEGLIERVRDDTGPYLGEAIASLADHPLVGEVRTYGLLAAIELVKSKDGPVLFENVGDAGGRCRDHALANGLMMRAVRDGMILSPPLTFTRDDIDKTVAIARIALDTTAAELGI
ncbi:aminotransferase [Alphaproteobacteria bacterium]|nr:aminotransferase [Alphaproteobacteria bacterium]